jgi:hypothetical protein
VEVGRGLLDAATAHEEEEGKGTAHGIDFYPMLVAPLELLSI